MAARRLSRGAPLASNPKQLELFIRQIDEDAQLQEAFDFIIKRPWKSLKFGEKITALQAAQEEGMVMAVFAQAVGARLDLITRVAAAKSEQNKDEIITVQRQAIVEKDEKIAEQESQIARLIRDYEALPKVAQS